MFKQNALLKRFSGLVNMTTKFERGEKIPQRYIKEKQRISQSKREKRIIATLAFIPTGLL